jgi:hypothetical protein
MCKKCEKNQEGEPHTGADISEAAAEPNRPLPWHVVDRLSRLWFVQDGKTRLLAVCFEAMVHLILYGLYSTNNAYQYDSLLIVWTHYKANCFDGLSQSRVLFFSWLLHWNIVCYFVFLQVLPWTGRPDDRPIGMFYLEPFLLKSLCRSFVEDSDHLGVFSLAVTFPPFL